MTKIIRKQLGKNLKEARLKAGMTQVEVADKAGIHPNYYARIERGEANPSQEKLFGVTKALKVKSSKILPY
ncbi:MAG TPA: helix-turn-helix transcriptional regulator [Patescibacteria group bacterium]|nr:helix-turn-helix transcriptional regulator [Patescibacteria group bacterium]